MLTLGNIHVSMTLRSLTRIGVHEALVLDLLLDAIFSRDGVNRHKWLVQSFVETGSRMSLLSWTITCGWLCVMLGFGQIKDK